MQLPVPETFNLEYVPPTKEYIGADEESWSSSEKNDEQK